MSKLSERSARRDTDPNVIEHMDEIVTFWNAGRYQFRELTSAPTHTGQSGETYVVNLGGTYHIYSYIGSGWRSVALT